MKAIDNMISVGSKQGELALYTLGMGIDCLFNTWASQPWARPFLLLPSGVGELVVYRSRIPFTSIGMSNLSLVSMSMGGLSYFYHHEMNTNEKTLFGSVYGRLIRPHNQKACLVFTYCMMEPVLFSTQMYVDVG